MEQATGICRLCLAIEVRMVTIADTPLQAVFEKITNNQLYTADRRPLAACYICCAQLRRCHKLMLRSVQAENVLTEILQEQPEVTMKSLAVIDRKANNLCEPLSIIKLESVDQLVPMPIAVKEDLDLKEQPEMVDVKTEIEYEDEDTSQLPDNVEQMPTEETSTSYDCKEPPETDDPMLEVEGRGRVPYGAPQFSSIQQEASTSSNIQRNEITFAKQEHLNTNTQAGEKFFECSQCLRRFKWKQCLERHESTHTGEKPYKCDICQRQFSQPHHLRDHHGTHTGERLNKCSICNATFRVYSSLKRHLNRFHTGEKLYKCTLCKTQFEYQKDYNEHLKSHSSLPKLKHECEVCLKWFAKKYHLQRHVMVHTGEKPHECTMCGRRFSEKRNMLKHVKTHYVHKSSGSE